MDKDAGESSKKVSGQRPLMFRRRGVLRAAAALAAVVVMVALLVVFDPGGLKQKLLWRISAPAIDSLALLPLENLSHDPGQDYFARQMTPRIISHLHRLGTFRVIAMPSVLRYQKSAKPPAEIARELNVSAVLRGGIRRDGERVRIELNLLHVPSNRSVWSHTYEGELRNVPALEAEISRAVDRETRGGFIRRAESPVPSSRVLNPQALDLLLRGQAVMMADTGKSELYVKQAIQLDPGMPEAYIALATNYYMRNMFPTLPPRDTYPPASEAALKSISLDPSHPAISQSHRILASAALEYDWNFAEAEKEFKSALQAAPRGPVARHMYAHYLLSMGRMQEAAAESGRALECDPWNSSLVACLSWHDITERNYEQAEKRALQALSYGAPDRLARLTLGWSYQLRGRHEQAIAEFQKAVVGWKSAVFPTAVLGHAYAAAGKQDAAREILDRLLTRSRTEYVSPYEIAMIHAGLGDRDRAFEWLDKAYEERATLLVYSRMDPRIWPLRSDARFQHLLRRMNFPQDAHY